jgi:hypothetical protein
MWLPARPVKGKPDLQLPLEIFVLHGVSGYQFQLSSTQLIALDAGQEEKYLKKHPIGLCQRLVALHFVAGSPQHPGNT